MVGWRQNCDRRGRSRSPLRTNLIDSRTVGGHVYDWSIGKTSAPAMRRHFQNMTRDAAKHGRVCDPVASLCSTIGGRSDSDTHCHRDFVKLLPKLGVDVEHLIRQVDGEHFLQIIPPHKLYQHLHKHHREKLDQMMGPPEPIWC